MRGLTVILGLCVAAGPCRAGEDQAPFVRLFDTGAPSAVALSTPALQARTGWRTVPEETLAHDFVGDAVFLNDRIAVALRKSGPGAEVYSKTPTGLVYRTVLAPCAALDDPAASLAAMKVINNSPGAVMLDAVFETAAGRSSAARFRLTAGEPFLEARAAEGTASLLVRSAARYVVVPDFFADDMVFGARPSATARVGLPVENLFLQLLDGGDAIVMCVWQSNDRNADLIFGAGGGERAIAGCEIECAAGKSIWVALLEGPGIWHGRVVAQDDAGRDIALEWTPPFQAKWRGSFAGSGGIAASWDFGRERREGYVSPDFGKIVYPCWLDGDRPVVRPPGLHGPLVVYPIDRTSATPLTVFCPIDIMRNTLGVGPCQYVLEAEGLSSKGDPTPDQVTRWVEEQFRKKLDRRSAEAIRERLGQMTRHIERVQSRIEEYGRIAQQVSQLCADQEPKTDLARAVGRIAADMRRAVETRLDAMKAHKPAAQLTEGIVALVGRENALADCQALCTEIRAIGTLQDNTLAKCRMAVRRMKQECRMADVKNTQEADLAGKIQELGEQALRGMHTEKGDRR